MTLQAKAQSEKLISSFRSFFALIVWTENGFGRGTQFFLLDSVLVALARRFSLADGGRGMSCNPRSWALQRWVRTRHQSTLNCRPIATAICLRWLLVVLALASTFRHLATGR